MLLFALLCLLCLSLLCVPLCAFACSALSDRPSFPFPSLPFAYYNMLHYTTIHYTTRLFPTPLRPSPSPNAAAILANVILLPVYSSHLPARLPTYGATDALRLHGVCCTMHRHASIKLLMLIKMLMATPCHRWVAAKARYEYDQLAQRRSSEH